MTERHARRRRWAWYVSALGYRWSYLQVAHSADADVLAVLRDRVIGARVVDCGCGPGVFSEKLTRAGAGHVLAVDANPLMVRQARTRLARYVEAGAATVVRALVDEEFFVRAENAFDLVIFKRSLYCSPRAAVATLRAADIALRPRGVIVVVHPERSLRRYAFGSPPRIRRHTAFHLVNRAISMVAARSGLSEYRTYHRAELLELLARSLPAARVEAAATSQWSYNVAVLTVRDQWRNGADQNFSL